MTNSKNKKRISHYGHKEELRAQQGQHSHSEDSSDSHSSGRQWEGGRSGGSGWIYQQQYNNRDDGNSVGNSSIYSRPQSGGGLFSS